MEDRHVAVTARSAVNATWWGGFGSVFELLMSIHGQQVLKDGCFNADPHPGNILLLEDGKTLGLIDFGQVIFLYKINNLYKS